jgi:hypothetical protein
MMGLLIMVLSALIMGAGISYHSEPIVFSGFVVMIWGLYEIGRIR